MKHIKTYEETSEIYYEVGDYIRFSDDILNKNPELKDMINCLKIINGPYFYDTRDEEQRVDVEYISFLNKLSTSFLYLSQIGGYATEENINEFEIFVQSKKYNL